MAHKHSDYGPSFSSSTVSEVEVILQVDEEEAGAKSDRFDKSEPGITDTWKYQGIPSYKGDVKQVPHCSYSGGDNKEEPELEENKAASVPQPQRRRPRIQFGLTALQVKELESVFEKNQYPDVITRKNLAKKLFLAESKVQHWFKMRRAKYRKHLESEMAEAALGTWNTPY